MNPPCIVLPGELFIRPRLTSGLVEWLKIHRNVNRVFGSPERRASYMRRKGWL